ncbi:MAG: hypothetical protein AB1540_06330 [Bdellovibrionota bacterium]
MPKKSIFHFGMGMLILSQFCLVARVQASSWSVSVVGALRRCEYLLKRSVIDVLPPSLEQAEARLILEFKEDLRQKTYEKLARETYDWMSWRQVYVRRKAFANYARITRQAFSPEKIRVTGYILGENNEVYILEQGKQEVAPVIRQSASASVKTKPAGQDPRSIDRVSLVKADNRDPKENYLGGIKAAYERSDLEFPQRGHAIQSFQKVREEYLVTDPAFSPEEVTQGFYYVNPNSNVLVRRAVDANESARLGRIRYEEGEFPAPASGSGRSRIRPRGSFELARKASNDWVDAKLETTWEFEIPFGIGRAAYVDGKAGIAYVITEKEVEWPQFSHKSIFLKPAGVAKKAVLVKMRLVQPQRLEKPELMQLLGRYRYWPVQPEKVEYEILKEFDADQAPESVHVVGNKIVVALGNKGLWVYDGADQKNIQTPGAARSLEPVPGFEDHVFVASRTRLTGRSDNAPDFISGGVSVIDLRNGNVRNHFRVEEASGADAAVESVSAENGIVTVITMEGVQFFPLHDVLTTRGQPFHRER